MRELLTPRDMLQCGKRRHRRLTDSEVIAVARTLDEIDHQQIMSDDRDAQMERAA